MQLHTILTSIPRLISIARMSWIAQALAIIISLLVSLSLLVSNPSHAQARGDDVITEMSQAFKKGDRKRLGTLLPMASGHVLEPWAAYWELRDRKSTRLNSSHQ